MQNKFKQSLVALSVIAAIGAATIAPSQAGILDGDMNTHEQMMVLGGLGIAVGEIALGAPVAAAGYCLEYGCFGMGGNKTDFDPENIKAWADLKADEQNALIGLLEWHTRSVCMRNGAQGRQWGTVYSHDDFVANRKFAEKKISTDETSMAGTMYGSERPETDSTSLMVHSQMSITEYGLAHRGVSCEKTHQSSGGISVAAATSPLEVWVTKDNVIKVRMGKPGKRFESVTQEVTWAQARANVKRLVNEDQSKNY